MRKVFALLTLAGLLSVASCGGSKTEGEGDSAKADSVMTPAAPIEDTTKTVVDSIAKDSVK